MPIIPDSLRPRSLTVDSAVPPLSTEALRPRSAIIVDEWGPYDWRTPRLWPLDSSFASPLRLAILGGIGRWRVTGSRGVATLSRRSGEANDTLMVTPVAGTTTDWRVTITDARGRSASYSRFDPIPGWDARFFAWEDSTRAETRTLFSRREPRLDFMWYRPPDAAIPAEKWGLEATTTVDLRPGTYTLCTISDDAIQVWVDGRLVIDHADPHESLVDHAPISAGRHQLRVRYHQVTGWVELRVEVVRGTVTSTGSPGPH